MANVIDKHGNAFTILGVLLISIFADSKYDLWDMSLGIVGIIISICSLKEILSKKIEEGKLYNFIVYSIFAISLTTIYFSFPCISFRNIFEYFNLKYLLCNDFFVFCVILSFVFIVSVITKHFIKK